MGKVSVVWTLDQDARSRRQRFLVLLFVFLIILVGVAIGVAMYMKNGGKRHTVRDLTGGIEMHDDPEGDFGLPRAHIPPPESGSFNPHSGSWAHDVPHSGV